MEEKAIDVVIDEINNEINMIIDGMMSPECDTAFTNNDSVAVYFKHLQGYHVAQIPYNGYKYTIHKIY